MLVPASARRPAALAPDMDEDRRAVPLAAEDARPPRGLEFGPEVAHGVPEPALLDPVLAEIGSAIDELAQSPAAPFAAPCLSASR